MSERKKIDRLFEEKFKDFEAMPPEETWANIEAMLDKKKKRRVIPFWWKLSGVAALLIIGFLISQSGGQTGATHENPVVNTDNPAADGSANGTNTNNDVRLKSNVDSSVAAGPQGTSNHSETIGNTKSQTEDNPNIETKTKLAAPAAGLLPSGTKTASHRSGTSDAIAVASGNGRHGVSKKNRGRGFSTNAPLNQAIAASRISAGSGSNPDNAGNPIAKKDEMPVAIGATPKNEPVNLDGLKGNINSKVAEKETNTKANDTASNKSVAKNELEELLNEKESKLKKESKRSRWQLASNVAPVFLGSASKGSPIDPSLSKNSKSYNTNYGYGIGVSYAVNKKISIRTALNKVNLSYDTKDISFFTGLQAKTLASVTPNSGSAMIHVESNVVPVSSGPSESGLLPFEVSFVHKTNGSLTQEMGYIEMPFEMTYSLLDKRFGINLIGGFSTLLLQDNSVTIVSSDNMGTVLGEANNLNDVHFSTNLGIGFKYNFYRSFEFNVEPTLKYQLNTFNANAGNFKPYIIGVYSGLSYKF